jgi:predicted DsbA family dithiol-disulfide isomerase
MDWRAYELRPDPIPALDPDGEYLHRVWSASVYPMARSLGMTLRQPPVHPRSRQALEAAEFARERDRFDAMHDALFRAFFEEGRDIGDVEVLLDVGGSVGLEREGLRLALDGGRYTEKVVSDGRLATKLGVAPCRRCS